MKELVCKYCKKPIKNNDFLLVGCENESIIVCNRCQYRLACPVKNKDGYGEYKEFPLGNKKYLCPKHGEITSTLSVTFPEYKGEYCQLCWVEKMIESGILKVEEITT